MKNILLGFVCCGLYCVPALAQAKSPGNSDQKFVDFAAQTDMMEAHLGQMAADQASGQNVKAYAQTLLTDHTNDYQQLSAAAGKAGLVVPKGLDAAHDKMIAPFEKLKGRAFDLRYEREMVMGHEKAIAEYKRNAANAQSADIKSYANTALPVLSTHLQGAKDLGKSKGK